MWLYILCFSLLIICCWFIFLSVILVNLIDPLLLIKRCMLPCGAKFFPFGFSVFSICVLSCPYLDRELHYSLVSDTIGAYISLYIFIYKTERTLTTRGRALYFLQQFHVHVEIPFTTKNYK